MIIGKMDRRITFQSRTDSVGSEGSNVPTWSDASTNWASYEQLPGGESIEHGRVNATARGVFRIRYSSGFTPDRTMRLTYNSTNLNIVDVREMPGRNRGWEIYTQVDAV